MLLFLRLLTVVCFRSRAALAAEILALRHQLGVLARTARRPRLRQRDRIFWVWLSRIWPDWRSALVIVKPETVITWLSLPKTQSEWRIALPVPQHRDSTRWHTLALPPAQASPAQWTLPVDAKE